VSSQELLPWPSERGLQLRSEAQELFVKALDDTGAPVEERQVFARKALALETSAFNWLEDSDWEDATHAELHAMGKRVHELFPDGCHLEWTGERYEHRCPVRIVHKRFGFSPSFRVGKQICRICGEDASECPHLRDRLYPVTGGRDDEGCCRVCHERTCRHEDSVEYMTRMTVKITEIVEVDHLAIVSRPRQPDARLLGIPVSTENLAEALGPDFSPGIEVHCSLCEFACTGFDRMESDPRLQGKVLPPQRVFDETRPSTTDHS